MLGRTSRWIITAVVGSSLLAAAAEADGLDRVKERGKLVVGVKNDYKPFGYLDGTGSITGFEIDLAKAVAKSILGREDAVDLVPVVASNRIELLNAGRIDVIFATLGVSTDRAKVIDFTEYYYNMAGIVLLAPTSTTIASWEGIKGRKICGVQGNLYNRTLEQKYGAEPVLFTGTADMFKAFEDNRCEAVAYDGPILQQKVNEDGWRDKYKIALDTFDYIPIAGGVRKGEPALLAAVDKGIRSAEAGGLMVEAEKSYGMGSSAYVAKRAADAKAAK